MAQVVESESKRARLSRGRFLAYLAGGVLAACHQPAEPTSTPVHLEDVSPNREVFQAERELWHQELVSWRLGNGKTVLEQFPYLDQTFEMMAGHIGQNAFSYLLKEPLRFYRSGDYSLPWMAIETNVADTPRQVRVLDQYNNVINENKYLNSVGLQITIPQDQYNPKLAAIFAAMYTHFAVHLTDYSDRYVRSFLDKKCQIEISSNGADFRPASIRNYFEVMPSLALRGLRRIYFEQSDYNFDQKLNDWIFYQVGSVLLANWRVQNWADTPALSAISPFPNMVDALMLDGTLKVENKAVVWNQAKIVWP